MIRGINFARSATSKGTGDTMKHRHSFFVEDITHPSGRAFELVNRKGGLPSTLKIRELNAAREWKSTVDITDLSQEVRILLEKF